MTRRSPRSSLLPETTLFRSLESVVPSDVIGRVFTGARAISENSLSALSDSGVRAFTGFRSTSENLASGAAEQPGERERKFILLRFVLFDRQSKDCTAIRHVP